MRAAMTGTISLLLFGQPTIAEQLSNEPSLDPAFAKAMAAVNAKLIEPQSARYGDLVRKVGAVVNGKPAEVVCGTVKTKGSWGTDVDRPFVYFITDGVTYLGEEKPQPEDVAAIIYGRFCKPHSPGGR